MTIIHPIEPFYDKNSKGAKAYSELADEVISNNTKTKAKK